MIFIDTGAFIAKYIESDQYHKQSLKIWKKILPKDKLYTSNYILDETITFLSRKTEPDFAVEKANILYQTQMFKILRPDIADELQALKIFKKYKDHQLSFTDCVTVALMRHYGIKKIYTFDEHFKYFNFKML